MQERNRLVLEASETMDANNKREVGDVACPVAL